MLDPSMQLPLVVLTCVVGVLFAIVFGVIGPRRDDRSAEIAELQRTVRLLIERQVPSSSSSVTPAPTSMVTMAPPTTTTPLHRRAVRSSSSSSTTSTSNLSNASPLHLNDSPVSSPPVPTSPPALTLPAPLTPSQGKKEVPVDVYAEMIQLQESIKQLERRNRELNRQLTLTEISNVVDIERKYNFKTPGASNQVKLTPSEVETMRAIFNLFDTEQNGSISVRELKALHAKLGENLSEAEAEAAMRDLDQDGTGEVNFNQFLYWWYESHKGGKKSSTYTSRFKLIHAKLSDAFNVDKVIVQDSGEPYTLEYRLNFYYKQPNSSLRQISPWHDVPLYRVGGASGSEGQILNMVCEIPKWTRAKFECATGEPFNPIKQDTQHGKLRYYKHGDIMFNYGFLPQTWEDPSYVPTDTNCPGDNDPIDVVEIGAKQLRTGEICAVKVLGVLALIDDGETDWKVIAVSIGDPMAHLLNDIDDAETHLPGAIKAIREYFRDYKSFSGKINSYALRAQAMPRHYALAVIEDTHEHWKNLQLGHKYGALSETPALGPVGGSGGGASAAAAAASASAQKESPSSSSS